MSTDQSRTPRTERLRKKYSALPCWDFNDIADGRDALLDAHKTLELELQSCKEQVQRLTEPPIKLGAHCKAGHDRYWITLYGNCMACRAEAAERKLDEARRDAERYRWLRKTNIEHWDEGLPIVVQVRVNNWGQIQYDQLTDVTIDAAIDAAKAHE